MRNPSCKYSTCKCIDESKEQTWKFEANSRGQSQQRINSETIEVGKKKKNLACDLLGAGTNNCGDEVAIGTSGDVMGVSMLDDAVLLLDPPGFITST